MFSSDDLERIRQAMIPLGSDNKKSECGKKGHSKKQECGKQPDDNLSGGFNICDIMNLTPPKLLIIAGLLAGVFEVDSVLADRDQNVEVVLVGALKRPTQLDQVMEQIGKMPFDQVMRSIMESSE